MTTLTFMIGASGSGKSTYAKQIAAETDAVVISSDAQRAALAWRVNPQLTLAEAENDQTQNEQVFKEMCRSARAFLGIDKSVIIDATNTTVWSRKVFVDIARELGAQVEAVWVNAPGNVCKSRNKARARSVPEAVIDKQLSKIQHPIVTVEVDRYLILDENFNIISNITQSS